MTIITLRNLGIILGKPLFSSLSLTVNAGDRIGIVAANGCGKSTLLHCLSGDMEPTSGDITRLRGLTQSIVHQHLPAPLMERTMRDAVLSALPADTIDSESWRADIIFDAMLVPEPFRERRLKELSGGWQRLAMLARAWITEPDVLLLDEPTNHLDLEKINVLENWLGELPRDTAVIIVSHDRAFLDNVTRSTLFLRPENSALFRLPYGHARAVLEEEDAADERRFQRDMKTAQQLRRQAAKLNNIGINSGSDLLTVKTKQLRERAEKIEEKARPAHIERSAGKIQLANRGTHARVLVTLEDVPVSTPDATVLFRTGRQFVRQGDRIVILGRNGVGKTRLMSLLQAAVSGAGQIDGIKASPRWWPDMSTSRSPRSMTTARPFRCYPAASILATSASMACSRARASTWKCRNAASPRFPAGRRRGLPCWRCDWRSRISICWTSPPTIWILRGRKRWRRKSSAAKPAACSSRMTGVSCGLSEPASG